MDTAAIDALFAPWSEPGPGAVWAVTQDGKEVHSGATGLADIPHGVKLDRRSIVRIGSQTKQFTVLLALMLEAEGKLSMDDEVHRHASWLPAFPHPVTLRHLATNTSGLRDVLEVMTLSGVSIAVPTSRARHREILARHRGVNFALGTEMIYCNTGFWLLSEIVEEVSGRSFNELLEARITGPLGMADTRLLPRDTQVVPGLSAQHARGPDGAWETARWGLAIGGEGGMASTLEDMLRWQANLHQPRSEMAPLLARMAEPVVYANGTRGLYAMGLVAEQYRGQRAVGHGGSVAGGRSESIRFPETGLGVVILANLDAIAPYSLALRIADVALAGRLAPLPPGGHALPAGLYRSSGGEVLAVEGNRMVTGGGPAELREVAPGTFVPERSIMHLTLRATDAGLDATWCGQTRPFRRVPDPAPPGPSLAGHYDGEEAGLAADVTDAEGGALLVLRSDWGVSRLSACRIDRDLMVFAPDTAPPTTARWTGTLLAEGRDLVVTTDRTKGLRLRRT